MSNIVHLLIQSAQNCYSKWMWIHYITLMKKHSDANTVCVLAVVRFGHRPPVTNTHT